MARDRQRSKRRRRTSKDGQNPAGSRAREIGLDDSSIEESGLTDPTPAPDPLKHASADVDEARAAEAGMVRGDLGADEIFPDELERAPDELEDPVDLRHEAVASTAGRATSEHKGGLRVIAFLRACVDELRRVQWPDRKHVFQATAVVLGFVLIAGAWLGLMDAIWQPVVKAII